MKQKINVPKLAIVFFLIKTNFLKSNGLNERNLTQGKGNRIVKPVCRHGRLGRLFFVSSLNSNVESGASLVCGRAVSSRTQKYA
jgi:hypothetical protein